MTRNELFYRVMLGSFVIALVMGAGFTAIAIVSDNPTVATRAIGAITSFLAALLGFASGYLFGQRNGNGN